MDTDSANSSEREHRLDEAVAGYLRALASGSAPDRQEVLARHPDLAPDLAGFFDDRDQVDRWIEPLRRDSGDGGVPPRVRPAAGLTAAGTTRPGPGRRTSPAAAPRTVGKFELLGLLGQGAFGTVFKALDVQLARVVALKVPRRDRLATDDDLERFFREGRNA